MNISTLNILIFSFKDNLSFKVLNILLDQNIQEIKNNLDVMIQSFDDNQPVIVVTDIPGGSTTQTAIQRISDNKLLYVVTGMNLGLVMSLSFLSLSQDDEDNKNKIRDALSDPDGKPQKKLSNIEEIKKQIKEEASLLESTK